MSDQLFTVRETAPKLRTTEAGLRWMLHAGTAPRSIKIGGRRMFRESDIERFIAEAS